jgi:hypothetical protein
LSNLRNYTREAAGVTGTNIEIAGRKRKILAIGNSLMAKSVTEYFEVLSVLL